MRLVSFIDFKIESSTDLYDYLDNWLKSVQKFSNEENHNIKKNFISTKNHIEITNDFEQANFRQLVNYFKSPKVLPALIIIPDSRYFAKNRCNNSYSVSYDSTITFFPKFSFFNNNFSSKTKQKY